MHIFNIIFLLFGTCLSKHVIARAKSPRNLELDPDIQDMDTRYPNPFAAFWEQGLVPGEGFPQIGMSAYGYGLPGLGLSPFLTPDALILAGVGNGEISEDDLKHAEEEMYNFDWLKGNDKKNSHHHHHNKDDDYADTGDYDGDGPDPDYPGCFKDEDCDQVNDNTDDHHHHYHHHYHDNGGGAGIMPSKKLFSAIAVAATTALIS